MRLPYEDVEIAENEHFNLLDARLCTEEFLRDAIEDLRCYTEYTVSVLKELSAYSNLDFMEQFEKNRNAVFLALDMTEAIEK